MLEPIQINISTIALVFYHKIGIIKKLSHDKSQSINLDIKRVEFVRYVIQYYTTSIEHESYFPWTVGSCSSKAKR